MGVEPAAYNPQDDLAAIVAHYEPQSVVYCGDTATSVLRAHYGEIPGEAFVCLPDADPTGALPLSRLYDLALITETLEHLDQHSGQLLLGQLRNMGAERIALLVHDSARQWQFRDLIGLGFKRLYHYEAPLAATLYAYDIATYNHRRDWNNSENWANPEMWDKARW